jgi:hypothetical protein
LTTNLTNLTNANLFQRRSVERFVWFARFVVRIEDGAAGATPGGDPDGR